MKNNRDRLTLIFKKNTDPFLLKLLIQTKDNKNSDRATKLLDTYMFLFIWVLLTPKTEVISEPIGPKYRLLVQILNFVKKIPQLQINYYDKKSPLLTLSRVTNAAVR